MIEQKKWVVGLVGVIAALIVLASVTALLVPPGVFAARKDQFQMAITQTLLPMFTAIAVTVVTYVLGQALISALGGQKQK